ncbi:hypothetical protein Tco_0661404 [Tanacetum coccineum]
MGDENPIRTLGDYSKPSHEGYKNTIELPVGNNMVPLRSDTIRTTKLRNDILMFQQHHGESLSEAWTRFKDLLQKVPHHGIDIWLQVQIFITMSIPSQDEPLTNRPMCSTQIHSSINAITIHPKQQSDSNNDITEENEEEDKDSPKNTHSTSPDPSISFITEKVLKFNSLFESLGLVPPSPNVELVCTKEEDDDVMFIEIIPKYDNSHKEEPELGVQEVEYFDIFPTRSELAYHKKLDPRENPNEGVSNFIGRIKGMHVFIGNFTYIVDFMIVEYISSIIDPRLSQVVLGKPFFEISNMTHDPPKGVVRFTNGNDEVSYKMPHKIEQYNSLSDLEKEHTKSVYLRNDEDKRIGVEYVMSKILGFYKECLELGPEYLTGIDDEGEVT